MPALLVKEVKHDPSNVLLLMIAVRFPFNLDFTGIGRS
jgi:hypothetical protein